MKTRIKHLAMGATAAAAATAAAVSGIATEMLAVGVWFG